jgi:hypothetical protein
MNGAGDVCSEVVATDDGITPMWMTNNSTSKVIGRARPGAILVLRRNDVTLAATRDEARHIDAYGVVRSRQAVTGSRRRGCCRS